MQKGEDKARQKAGALLRQSLSVWEEMGVKPYIEKSKTRLAAVR